MCMRCLELLQNNVGFSLLICFLRALVAEVGVGMEEVGPIIVNMWD